ncbi:MAG TPA: HEAT repeat domain-containing protein [Archangium sp.]|uniref:HEAT repeat domain-containing protein n=1 Tax=Archangium sp. TaxID=1872627 RepID=UPI002E2F68B4|nr:HEAT repeat domain-containing protein [Archangium sp.]HEX5746327.1 HEAT repeat domain-containing protein [Archangium sp.]
MEQLKDELVDAHSWGEEERARALVSRLGEHPRKARALLEAMLQDPDAQVRQAAAFGLGELGGASSVKLLEQQLALEEARGDFDGASVAEDITLALGRIEEHGARTSLTRRLERLVEHESDTSEVNTVAYALWRRRHPDLLPIVQRSLEQLALPLPNCLHGLLMLLEKSPEELSIWANDASVSVDHKTGVLALLEEELPDTLVSTLRSFIAVADALPETTLGQHESAVYYCDRLFSVLLEHMDRILPKLPTGVRSELRDVARKVIVATSPSSSLRAASLLQFIGQPGDAAFLEAHRPAEPILAEVFDRAAKGLRGLQKNQ